MADRWLEAGAYVVDVCPDCRLQQPGLHGGAHRQGCSNYGKTFNPEQLRVVPFQELGPGVASAGVGTPIAESFDNAPSGQGPTPEMVEAGRRAINEQIPEWQMQHALEGKPPAEEAIAKAVLNAALSTKEGRDG